MAESLNSSERNILSWEKSEKIIVVNEELGKIIDEIKNFLLLNDNQNKVVEDLLENGRQSLTKYKDDIVSEIYKTAMNGCDNELIFLLKKYFEKKWEMEHGKSYSWFLCFLEQYKKGENVTVYECVLNRTANCGNTYMKNSPLLSIVLQLIFENIDDDCLKETNIFENLWFTVTNDGLRSIKRYFKYTDSRTLQEQLQIPSALFQALREYYREKVFSTLKESEIINRENLYELILDNITEHGWRTDLKPIGDKLTPRSYRKLLESLHLFHQKQNPPEETASMKKSGNEDLNKVFQTFSALSI